MTNAITMNNTTAPIITNANRIVTRPNANVITSVEQYSSILPTSSWEANNWDNRTLPWEGLENGKDVSHNLSTDVVFNLAGLNFGFEVVELFDPYGNKIPMIGVLRDDNHFFLGSGTKRFTPLGNERTRELCDILHSLGFGYENAGVFDGGKVTYVSMKWKGSVASGEEMNYYVVIVNSFDGSKPFGVFITPVRVWCKNTLALAIKKAKRFWKLRHTTNAHIRLEEVKEALNYFDLYINGLETEISTMKLLTINDNKVKSFINTLFPIEAEATGRVLAGVERKRAELLYRYQYAPDLQDMEHSAFRFINAVSDFVDHSEPARRTASWRENRFANNLGGSEILDVAYKIVQDEMI